MTAAESPNGRFGTTVGGTAGGSRYVIHAAVLTAAYASAHLLLLVERGVYWDDWNFIHADPALLSAHLEQMGVPFLGLLHHALLATAAPLAAYRALTFGCYLIAALCMLRIMRVTPGVTPRQALVVAIIAAILPLNAARVSICCEHYAVCNALMFGGFALLTVGPGWAGVVARAGALAAFAASFSTTSIIAFFPIVLLHLYWRKHGRATDRATVSRFAMSHADLIILPIAYLVVRVLWFQPHGEYAGYNQITAKGLLNVGDVFKAFTIFFFGGGKLVPKRPEVLWLVPLLWLGVMWALGRWSPLRADRRHLALAGFGLLAMVMAIYPYVAVGKIPAPWDWDTRHELLIPFGAAIFVCSICRLWLNAIGWTTRAVSVMVTLFISSSVARDWFSYLEYQRDWHKQSALVIAFRADEDLRDHGTFIVQDQTKELNARDRSYRTYEWSGIMREAFGTQTRFMSEAPVGSTEVLPTGPGVYGLDDYVRKDPERMVTIAQRVEAGYAATISGLYWSWVDSERFSNYIEGLLDVHCFPYVVFTPQARDSTGRNREMDSVTDDLARFRHLLQVCAISCTRDPCKVR